MRVLVLVCLCLAAVSAVPAKTGSQRITGGSVTTIENWPEMVAMLFSSNLSVFAQDCGGSILNNRSVLTAAHCLLNSNAVNWRLRIGSTFANSGGIVYNTAQLIRHPNYNVFNQDNDIAILRSSSVISHNNAARPASIASSNYNLADNQVVWATGWGAISSGGAWSEQLRQVQIWAINQSICRSRYAAAGITLTDNMLCAGWLDVGGRDQCSGDSGGPLFHNRVVVGVSSWGFGCGMAEFPSVNARVSRYTSWIQSNA